MTNIVYANNYGVIGQLMAEIEGLKKYVNEILISSEEKERQYLQEIVELQRKNSEYESALKHMREYIQGDDKEETAENDITGHDLLCEHGKILVIGGEKLGINTMQGISKGYGFAKKDFEYIAYDKAKDFLENVRGKSKYKAIIWGACPHKTSANAGYNNVLELFKANVNMPYTIDARSKSGELKVTKESFRTALDKVFDYLMDEYLK